MIPGLGINTWPLVTIHLFTEKEIKTMAKNYDYDVVESIEAAEDRFFDSEIATIEVASDIRFSIEKGDIIF